MCTGNHTISGRPHRLQTQGSTRPSQPKPLVKADPQAEAEAAIRELAGQVHTAFLGGDPAKLAPLALWGLPEETLHAGMKQVYIVDARISAARIKAVPATNRTTVHTNTLEKLELFLAEPDRQFEPMKAGLTEGVQEFKKQNTTLLTQAAAEDAPDWTQSTAPSIVVRPGINLATPLPEGAADVLFSCAGRSYQLKLNNCVKLPGHGWVLGADIELIDLAAQAEAEKAWTEDFPAAQLRATEQKKRLLVNFTGSDWDPLCIALNKNVLTQPGVSPTRQRKLCPREGGFSAQQTASRSAAGSQSNPRARLPGAGLPHRARTRSQRHRSQTPKRLQRRHPRGFHQIPHAP